MRTRRRPGGVDLRQARSNDPAFRKRAEWGHGIEREHSSEALRLHRQHAGCDGAAGRMVRRLTERSAAHPAPTADATHGLLGRKKLLLRQLAAFHRGDAGSRP
jgi:hypothetical protein